MGLVKVERSFSFRDGEHIEVYVELATPPLKITTKVLTYIGSYKIPIKNIMQLEKIYSQSRRNNE
jgi:hypothetical protein